MKTIRFNQTSDDVRLLQNLLEARGFDVKASGTFDQATLNATCKFQQENGLDADGIVGFESWDALLFADKKAEDRLQNDDFELVSRLLEVEPACVKAVQEVETGGKGGFFAPQKPAILFEGHIFWAQLKNRNIDPATFAAANADILYPKWEKGHYKGGIAEYDRLEKAKKINEEAAIASASWGMFQIMGFNFASCGQKSVKSFVDAMHESECRQLRLFAAFVVKNGLQPSLKEKDWATFAKRYNGPAYAENKYDQKLAAAYKKYNVK